jgi:2'-5' RNA ligase
VVWLGVKPEPKLLRLAEEVSHAALSAGIILEKRPFSPHLTLARLKLTKARGLCTFLDRCGALILKPFSVREFTLFQSRLTSRGTMHSQVRSFPLINAG